MAQTIRTVLQFIIIIITGKRLYAHSVDEARRVTTIGSIIDIWFMLFCSGPSFVGAVIRVCLLTE